MAEVLNKRKLIISVIISLLILVIVMYVSVFTGTKKISIIEVLKGDSAAGNIDYDIFIIRTRKVILAALVGAALASSGVILQGSLRNPLADPYILGISSGAGLGAIIATISGISFNLWAGSPIASFAFAGAIFTVWLVWQTGQFAGKTQVTNLLLAGVVINAFFSAVIMFLTSIARSEQLRTTIFWLMGNITEKDWRVLIISSICIIGGIIVLLSICKGLNAMSLGENEAKGLGVDTRKVKAIAFGFTAFITAVAVSLSGLVGFVGLIVPHGVRLVLGPDHRQLLPVSAVTGGIFVVIADTIGRTVFGQEQLPVGVITAIAGGPFFLIMLARYSRKISWLR